MYIIYKAKKHLYTLHNKFAILLYNVIFQRMYLNKQEDRMELPTLFQYVAHLTAAPLRVFPIGSSTCTACYSADEGMPDPLPAAILALQPKAVVRKEALLASFGHIRYFALLPGQNAIYILGPVYLSATLTLQQAYPDASTLYPPARAVLCDVPVFIYSVLLLRNELLYPAIMAEELLARNSRDAGEADIQQYYTRMVFANRENNRHHNAYSQELRLTSAIERGDMTMVKQCQQEKASGELGTMATDMDRNVRNLSIAAVTLASRAAIRGGVNYELAFSLCDSYVMQIETLPDVRYLQPLVESAQRSFASMVHSIQSNAAQAQEVYHPLVEKSKNYIYAQLHGKIVLNDVAATLGVNPSYLSTLFKQHEEISFTDFVLREKIELAKTLLLYSHATYAQIAATLGFSSQSHLGKYFKRQTGMTPIQFRRRFAATEVDG